jgi:hypothetical protein
MSASVRTDVDQVVAVATDYLTPRDDRDASDSVDETPERPYSVRLLDVSGHMASVRTDADWGVDYLHLAKIEGE